MILQVPHRPCQRRMPTLYNTNHYHCFCTSLRDAKPCVLLFCVHRLVLCLFPVMSVARVVDHGSPNRTVVCSLQRLGHTQSCLTSYTFIDWCLLNHVPSNYLIYFCCYNVLHFLSLYDLKILFVAFCL